MIRPLHSFPLDHYPSPECGDPMPPPLPKNSGQGRKKRPRSCDESAPSPFTSYPPGVCVITVGWGKVLNFESGARPNDALIRYNASYPVFFFLPLGVDLRSVVRSIPAREARQEGDKVSANVCVSPMRRWHLYLEAGIAISKEDAWSRAKSLA